MHKGDPVSKRSLTKIHQSVFEVLALSILILAVPFCVYLDVVVIGHGIPELSVTEITQETLIFLSAILCWLKAWRCVCSRGFFVLLGGFFACMFIRELDFLFDMIHHGFWIYPVILITVVCSIYAWVCRDTILLPLAQYVSGKPFVYVSLGLIIVFIFSRIFGSGELFWVRVMGPDYKGEYKQVIQEGLELLGYVMIFYGSCLSVRPRRRFHSSAYHRQDSARSARGSIC